MASAILEQRLGFIPGTKQGELQNKIDVYTGGISQMYSGTEGPPPLFEYQKPAPINISRPINKPYGQHENKLIDSNGITGVYSNFKKKELYLSIFGENLGEHHSKKENLMNLEIPYNEMFEK